MPHINAPSAIIHIVTRHETIGGHVIKRHDIDEEAALDILTEYGERFSEYPWLEDENIVMDSQVDTLIEEYVKGAK